MHDLCWKKGAPDALKRTRVKLEEERPETLEGWRRLFERAGLVQLTALDIAGALAQWVKASRRGLGFTRELQLVRKIIRRWGLRGAWRALRSTRIFSSHLLGYALVVGTKR